MWQKFFWKLVKFLRRNTIFRIFGTMHEKQCLDLAKVHITQPEGYARCAEMQSRISKFLKFMILAKNTIAV